jgi:DNA topoisomerase I
MKLFIVESPTKVKTLARFLGKDFKIQASMGHVREIPKKGLGVDVLHGFSVDFQIIESKRRNTLELLENMRKADQVYFAQDLDREGELIAWHLFHEAKLPPEKVRRVVFNEITKSAVLKAVENPRDLDQSLIDAGLGRTILDRLIGYKLSPLIWKRFDSDVPLSVGRVQTVALRVLVDRDREIDAFQKQEFYNIRADFKEGFSAEIILPEKKRLDRSEAVDLLEKLKNPKAKIQVVDARTEERKPKAPFTTASLQQESSLRLKISARDTMRLAQDLYEGVSIEGQQRALITYMRTDAVILAKEALLNIREHINSNFGPDYLPKKATEYKSKTRNAQEAHEAIRPVDFSLNPGRVKPFLKPDQARLYELIWNRTVASQMKPARFAATKVDIDINGIGFRARGRVLKFDGFLRVYRDLEPAKEGSEDRLLPPLKKGQDLDTEKIVDEKKFTKPPPRYTEASLVKFLEKNGIGRPSTYASIIETLLKRNYASLEKRKFITSELGRSVLDWVHGNFESVVDVEFTARVEDSLDEIAQGKLDRTLAIESFYKPLRDRIVKLQGFVEEELSEADRICPDCKAPLEVRSGKFGQFLGCSRYPDCKHIKKIRTSSQRPPVTTGIFCDLCGGEYHLRRSSRGKYFSCSNYPQCRKTRNRLSETEFSVFQEHLGSRLRKSHGE